MAKSQATVEELVNMIKRGKLRLPEMQRRYVWRSTQVRDLLDSLYRGYPSGTILVWDTDMDVPLQDMAIDQEENPVANAQLLLDGQQRLTSLAAVIRGEPVTVRNRQRPIELLFNLEHPDKLTVITEVEEDEQDDENESDDENGEDRIDDEADSTEAELQKRFNNMTFVVATSQLASLPNWVKVSDVFKSDSDKEFLERAGVENFSDPNYQRYTTRLTRLRAIRKYEYRMDILESKLPYEEVTEIFVRVNSRGAKLRSSDLARAQITACWRDSLKEFEAFQEKCKDGGFDLDLGSVHLRGLIAFATGQSRFHTVASRSVKELQEGWAAYKNAMDFTLNFMRSNVKIESPALLASPFLLIAVACFVHRCNNAPSSDQAEQLRRWILRVNAKGRYSRGSSETLLDQDLAIIRRGGDVSELMERLRQQVGRLSVEAEELEGRNQRSALFKTMFLAFRDAEAKDWRSNLAIDINHAGAQDKLQFHHIFPKAVLKQSYPDREANDIANLCFISGQTNRQIRDRTPRDYFPELLNDTGEEPFADQCIPIEDKLLGTENYREFLKKRRELIANRLNEFLEVNHETR